MAHCLRCRKTNSEFWLCDSCFGQDEAIAAQARAWQVEVEEMWTKSKRDEENFNKNYAEYHFASWARYWVLGIRDADLGDE